MGARNQLKIDRSAECLTESGKNNTSSQIQDLSL